MVQYRAEEALLPRPEPLPAPLPAIDDGKDHNIQEDYCEAGVYFKSLRANIRAKVHALQWKLADSESEASYHISETQKYLGMMNDYMAGIRTHLKQTSP